MDDHLDLQKNSQFTRLDTLPQLPLSRNEFLAHDRTKLTIIRDWGATLQALDVDITEIIFGVEWVEKDGKRMKQVEQYNDLRKCVIKAADVSRRNEQGVYVLVHLGIQHDKLSQAAHREGSPVSFDHDGNFIVSFVPTKYDKLLEATRYPYHMSPIHIHHYVTLPHRLVSGQKREKPLMLATTASGVEVEVVRTAGDLAAVQFKNWADRLLVPMARLAILRSITPAEPEKSSKASIAGQSYNADSRETLHHSFAARSAPKFTNNQSQIQNSTINNVNRAATPDGPATDLKGSNIEQLASTATDQQDNSIPAQNSKRAAEATSISSKYKAATVSFDTPAERRPNNLIRESNNEGDGDSITSHSENPKRKTLNALSNSTLNTPLTTSSGPPQKKAKYSTKTRGAAKKVVRRQDGAKQNRSRGLLGSSDEGEDDGAQMSLNVHKFEKIKKVEASETEN
ncbi:hypothetical protein LTR70_001988 [Exophiala xenobiotica]|uniref:Uncharacterized protein n=1 Tax=Lithohypha guttulata TaxID=1690604 RepID=A0ABR0KAJ2_9EURO|nr:hypothetical protein LTR24_005085 [Lithohypha guttulata]KAK5326224.1 hypothetical protein LTR70_001988 [Exophiala xenobiotica]